jgi:replicative DNA helicase
MITQNMNSNYKYYNFKQRLNDLPKLLTKEEIKKLKIDPTKEHYISIFRYNDNHEKLYKATDKPSLKGSNFHNVLTDVLVWDFDDSNNPENARTDVIELAHRLNDKFDIDPDDMHVSYSGNKGFHLEVKLDRDITQDQFKQITTQLVETPQKLKTYDASVNDPARVLRMENTANPKTGLYKVPLHIEELAGMEIAHIKQVASKPRTVLPFKNPNPIKLPEVVFKIPEPKKVNKVADPKEFDKTAIPKGWKPYKWALAQGFFEKGERHNALMVIAATCRALGYDKTSAYYLCKNALKQQANRLGIIQDDKKEELWHDIIEGSVYSDSWEGGAYSPQTNPWLKQYCERMNFNIEREDPIETIVQLHDIEAEFIDYVKNIDQNTILTGIQELDTELPLTIGMNLGIIGAASSGKCLGKDTPVLMYDGSIKMVQDIKVGELLMGDDSTPRTVITTCTGKEQLYKVHQDNGSPYIVNESHILSLKSSLSRHGNVPVVKDISILDYLNTNKEFKRYYKGYKVGVEFQEKETLLDPYFLGIWLGDGDKNEARITNNDPQIIEYLIEYSKKLGMGHRIDTDRRNKVTTVHITNGKTGGKENPLMYILRQEKLEGNKHIPANYLLNSRENRMKLLAGLIDSDGHFNTSNHYEFCFSDKNLADQIVFLVRSLGFKCTINQKVGGCMYKGKFREGLYHRIYINGDEINEVPVKLLRKKAIKNSIKAVLSTSIVVEKLEIGDYYGFEIDGNHRFLLGDFTVTHNTALSLKILENTSNAGVVSVFASLDMRRNRLYEKLLYRLSGLTRTELYKRIQENNAEDIFQKVRDEYKNVYFYDRSCPSVDDIRAYILNIEAKSGKKVKLVMVDYFERVNAERSDDTAASKEVAGKLQDLVNDLNVCLITLVQPNKFSLAGGPDTPILNYTAIKGSSYLYQAFRSIISIWRPFFTPELKDKDKYMQMAILKNDLGELNTFDFAWEGKRGEIRTPSEEQRDELAEWMEEKNKKKQSADQEAF